MAKRKFVQGMSGGHRSKKDYRLQVLKSGKVIEEIQPISFSQARGLAYWWNAISPFGVQIGKYKSRRRS